MSALRSALPLMRTTMRAGAAQSIRRGGQKPGEVSTLISRADCRFQPYHLLSRAITRYHMLHAIEPDTYFHCTHAILL